MIIEVASNSAGGEGQGWYHGGGDYLKLGAKCNYDDKVNECKAQNITFDVNGPNEMLPLKDIS